MDHSKYHLTLGKFRDYLANLGDPDIQVVTEAGESIGLGGSYRGFYDHYAFEIVPFKRTVGDFLVDLNDVIIGKVYEGYKGGNYIMTEDTPLWISDYGVASGRAMIFAHYVEAQNLVVVFTKDVS